MFHIPAYFIELIGIIMVVSGIILTGTGIYLAIHETKDGKEHPPLRKIKIFKLTLEISRPVLIIIIGIFVTISPLGLQYYTKNLVLDDDTGLFSVVSDTRILDLSSHFFIDKNDPKKNISKVRQIRNVRLSKNLPIDEIRYRYSTSGRNVTPKCLSHSSKTLTLGSEDGSTISDILNLKIEKEVIIDISKHKVGEEFVITCEAIFENAFQTLKREWTGAVTKYKTKKLEIKLKFKNKSDDRSYSRKYIKKDGAKKLDASDQGKLNNSDSELSWVILDPNLFDSYILGWGWE